MFDYKGYTCHLPVSNIVGHDCKMPFHNNGKGLYPCGMPHESEGRRYYLQTRGALEHILKSNIDFLEKIISVNKLEQL